MLRQSAADSELGDASFARASPSYQDDQIPYIELLGDYWGELCVSKEIASRWADQLIGTCKMAWSPDPNLRGFFKGTTNCLSALLAAERYDELLALLDGATRCGTTGSTGSKRRRRSARKPRPSATPRKVAGFLTTAQSASPALASRCCSPPGSPTKPIVSTEKVGRVRTCRLGPRRLEEETAWIERYRQLWAARFDELDTVVDELKQCAAGDIHGALDRLYEDVLAFEESLGAARARRTTRCR